MPTRDSLLNPKEEEWSSWKRMKKKKKNSIHRTTFVAENPMQVFFFSFYAFTCLERQEWSWNFVGWESENRRYEEERHLVVLIRKTERGKDEKRERERDDDKKERREEWK